MLFLSLCACLHTASVVLLAVTAEDVTGTTDPGALLLRCAAAAALLLSARAAVAVHLAAAAAVLSAAGLRTRTLHAAAIRLAPRALRGALCAAAAGGIGLASLAGTAHAAGPPAPAAPPASSETARTPSPLAWPITEPVRPAASPTAEADLGGDRRSPRSEHTPAGTESAPADGAVSGGEAPRPHRVAPGESLWSIVRDADPQAPPEQVAEGVEALHAANRTMIGPDPSLILPGQRLELP
ncbi:hypothetical protein GCM10009823_00390 [Brevibacterium salitolerans]|uniref:LysM domain-containing protein n=2 Tax=Brevibacterium salitolerans TaxID=1403566 RepID=A0ABN2W8M4_9MICO